MKKFIIFILSGVFALVSCAPANVMRLSGKEENREVSIGSSYNSLKVTDVIEVTYSEEATVLTLSADSAVLPYVKVKEKGGELNISLECSGHIFKGGNIGKIKAEVPASSSIRKIELEGASSLKGESIEAENFTLAISGASSLDMDFDIASEMNLTVDGVSKLHSSIAANSVIVRAAGASGISASVVAETLDMKISEASEANVFGKTGSYNLKASGASNVSSGKKMVETDKFVCDISGAATVAVRCNVSADGNISGASRLKVYGGGNIGISTSGASSLSVIR